MAPPISRPFDLRDIIVVVVMNLFWGLNIIAVKMAVTSISPLTAGLLRQAIVLLACLPALRLIPGRMGTLLLLGALNGALFIVVINYSLVVAENVSALAVASQLGVPFALILAVVFLKEHVGAAHVVGVLLAFAGVVVMMFDPRIVDERLGILLTALGALIWASGSLLQRHLHDVPVLTTFAWIGLVGTIMLVPVCMLIEPEGFARLPDIPLRALGWVAFSALGSTLCGHGGMAWLLQRHPVSSVTPLTLAAPVVAVAASALYFGSSVTAPMLAGAAMVLAGVVLITLRNRTARHEEHKL